MITDIRDRPLSEVVATYYVCDSCALVHRDKRQAAAGPCIECDHQPQGISVYFPIEAHVTIDLMQEAYHLKRGPDTPPMHFPRVEEAHRLAVLVYFSTLGELLLEYFIRRMFFALEVRPPLVDLMLNEIPFGQARIKKIFPAVCNAKWNEVVKQEAKSSGVNFQDTVATYLAAVDTRNELLHAGNQWDVPSGLDRSCLDELQNLLELFSRLHNRFVRPYFVGQRMYAG